MKEVAFCTILVILLPIVFWKLVLVTAVEPEGRVRWELVIWPQLPPELRAQGEDAMHPITLKEVNLKTKIKMVF